MCVDDIPILSKPNVVLDVKVELPSWKEIWSVYSPTVLSIPNPLIADWCEILEKLVNPLTTLKPDNTEIHWKRFFMVSKCLWYAPIRAGQKKRGTRILEFKRRIMMWKENKIMELWAQFKVYAENFKKSHQKRKINQAKL